MRNLHPDPHTNDPHHYETWHKWLQLGGLMQTNRLLFFMMLVMMVVVLILGYWVVPSQQLMRDVEARQRLTDSRQALHNPALSAEVDQLKAQLVGIISGSIESKLRTLEASLAKQQIPADTLHVLQDLKNDIQLLRNYSQPTRDRDSEARQETALAPPLEQQLLGEMVQLKGLLYISMVSCGLMFAAVAGVWLHGRARRALSAKPTKLLGKL